MLKCFEAKADLSSTKLSVNFESIECFEDYCQVFAVWVPDREKDPYRFYKTVLNYAKNTVFRDDRIKLCLNNKDLEDALRHGKRVAILSLESATPLCRRLDRVEELFNDGVRVVTLTWNGKNQIAGGADASVGLSRFGKSVVDKLNKYNIAVDLSHLNERSFFEVCELADSVLATHSNCFKICRHKRNLKSGQLKAILNKNGIVGLNFYPDFLNGEVFESLYQNIQCLLDEGLENNISLGGDFDGADMSQRLDKPSRLIDFADFLTGKNLSRELIEKIFFNNSRRYFNNLLTKQP